jgi:hypothetical protein
MRPLCLLILLLVPAAEARDKMYATGQLAQVTMSDIVFPLNVPPLCQNCAALQLPLPLGVTYMFDIQQDDITYVGACTAKTKKSYAADWVIHDPVEYRVEKDKLFLKRPNGKELRLGLVTRIRNTKQEPAQPVSSQTAPQKSARLMIPDCH